MTTVPTDAGLTRLATMLDLRLESSTVDPLDVAGAERAAREVFQRRCCPSWPHRLEAP